MKPQEAKALAAERPEHYVYTEERAFDTDSVSLVRLEKKTSEYRELWEKRAWLVRVETGDVLYDSGLVPYKHPMMKLKQAIQLQKELDKRRQQ